MSDYFQKFKDLKATIGEIKEETKQREPLSWRIHYDDTHIYLDKKKAYKLRETGKLNLIGILEETQDTGTIYACYHSHLDQIALKNEKMQLLKAIALNINITDILPVARENSVIVCGTGVTDIRLLNLDNVSESENITTSKEYKKLLKEIKDGTPRFHVDHIYNHEISLAICDNNPHQPTLQVTDTLNSALEHRGIDIKKTLELCKKFKIWR